MKKVFRTWKYILWEISRIDWYDSKEEFAKNLLWDIESWCKKWEGLQAHEIVKNGDIYREEWMVVEGRNITHTAQLEKALELACNHLVLDRHTIPEGLGDECDDWSSEQWKEYCLKEVEEDE